jgi:hypothetical protein
LVKGVDTLKINDTQIQNISLSSYEQSVAPKLAVDRDNDYDDVSIVYGPRFLSKRQICLPLSSWYHFYLPLVLFRFQLPVLATR